MLVYFVMFVNIWLFIEIFFFFYLWCFIVYRSVFSIKNFLVISVSDVKCSVFGIIFEDYSNGVF